MFYLHTVVKLKNCIFNYLKLGAVLSYLFNQSDKDFKGKYRTDKDFKGK